MKLNQNRAFLVAIAVSILIVLTGKSYFLLRSNFAKGEVVRKNVYYGRGKNAGPSHYPIVQFTAEGYDVTFMAGENLNYKIGDKVNVVYLRSDRTDARIFSFTGFWLPGFIYGLIPLCLLTGIVFAYVDPDDIIEIHFNRSLSIKKQEKAVPDKKQMK